MANRTNPDNTLDLTDIPLEERKKLARKNLDTYPIIKKLFGDEWILEQINTLEFNEENGVHGNGLAFMLSISPDKELLEQFQENIKKATQGDIDAGMMAYLQGSGLYEPKLKLEELEQNLGILREEKLSGIIKKAKNSEQFWQTLSEIEIAAYFKRKGMLKEIEPLIDGKTPDILIDILGEDFCIEIFTPLMPEKLKDSIKSGEAVSLGNRARDKLWDKLGQLPRGKPSIIIINRAFSEIDLHTVGDAILGTQSLLLPKDMTKKPKPVRQLDGIAQSYDLSNLKAIILYKRQFDGRTSLITSYDIKPIIVEDGDNLSDEQHSVLTDVFNSMTFMLA
jgi:hypothetical protein